MTEAQKKYIITEGQMERIHRMILPITGLTKLVAKDRQSLMQAIRSRPYKSSDKVLDIIRKTDPDCCPHKGCHSDEGHDGLNCRDCLIKWIEAELRQKER